MSDEYRRLERVLREVEDYVGLIGKAEPHFKYDSTGGKFSRITVETEINQQAHSGAPNYHKCKGFDAYLSEVIRKNASNLAAKVVDQVKQDMTKAAASEIEKLEKRLAEVKAFQQERAGDD